jgi:predicted dehydrogenase
MPDHPYRVAIVGAGAIGRAHANAVRQLPHQPSLAVFDPNQAAIAAFCQEFPDAQVHPDLTSLLADRCSSEDIVVLAMPRKPRWRWAYRFWQLDITSSQKSLLHLLQEKVNN